MGTGGRTHVTLILCDQTAGMDNRKNCATPMQIGSDANGDIARNGQSIQVLFPPNSAAYSRGLMTNCQTVNDKNWECRRDDASDNSTVISGMIDGRFYVEIRFPNEVNTPLYFPSISG